MLLLLFVHAALVVSPCLGYETYYPEIEGHNFMVHINFYIYYIPNKGKHCVVLTSKTHVTILNNVFATGVGRRNTAK
jgi:hypothetical protein